MHGSYRLEIAALFALCSVTSCTDEITGPNDEPAGEVDVTRAECENLNPGSCLAPWPSTRYLVPDESSATGRRIDIPPDAMPHDRMGGGVDPSPYNRFDGFSLNTPIATAVDGGALDTTTLASELDPFLSITDDSPTVLLDAESGERVVHIAEVDDWGGGAATETTLYLRPLRPLEEDRRYVVAIRGLSFEDGAPVIATPYFAALRDGHPTTIGELEARRDGFEQIFAALEDAGIARDSLSEAWEFRTGTAMSSRRELLHMRDDALTRIGDRGTRCTVETVETDFGHTEVYRRIKGTFEIPLYAESEEPGSRLVRGAHGLPEFQRMGTARFTAIIPNSVAAADGPVPLAIWGHSLLGESDDLGFDEGESGLRVSGRFGPIFEGMQMAAVGTDWWGLGAEDANFLAGQVNEFSRFSEIPDRLMQAMINFLTLTRSFSGVCGELPEWEIDGSSVIDPSDRRYVGISGGAVLGSTFAALTPDIERFALIAGGSNWTTLVSRSFVFIPFNLILSSTYRDKRERDIMLAMTAHLWDLADGANFAPLIGGDKQVLLQTVSNDALVSNVTSDYLARVAGLPLIQPSVRVAYDVPDGAHGAASGQVMYDLGAEDLPIGTALPAENGVHGSISTIPALREQLRAYLHGGTIESFCDGSCDPD